MSKDVMTARYSIRGKIIGLTIFEFDPTTLQLRGKTAEGSGTINRLRINDAIQIEARRHWVELALYP
jgi:hypothetical protein